VICSDKTGTLTENQMTVQWIVTVEGSFAVTGGGYEPRGEIVRDGAPIELDVHPAVRELLVAGLVCNDSRVVEDHGSFRVDGDPTEAALIVAAGKAALDPEALADELPRIDSIPFESERQYMATLHLAGDQAVIYVKGSLEQVLERCTDQRSAAELEQLRRAADELSAEGLRVLALARKLVPADTRSIAHGDVADGLVLLGVQAMLDPPRAGVAAAIEACQRAGIQVKMITGDHGNTAVAIAERLAIEGAVDDHGRLLALTGRELAELSDDEL